MRLLHISNKSGMRTLEILKFRSGLLATGRQRVEVA